MTEETRKGWGYAFKLVIATIVSVIIFIIWSTFVLSIGIAIGEDPNCPTALQTRLSLE